MKELWNNLKAWHSKRVTNALVSTLGHLSVVSLILYLIIGWTPLLGSAIYWVSLGVAGYGVWKIFELFIMDRMLEWDSKRNG